jgi:hypothetical protein
MLDTRYSVDFVRNDPFPFVEQNSIVIQNAVAVATRFQRSEFLRLDS